MVSISKQKDSLIQKLSKNLNDWLDFIKAEAEDRTPEDTKKLLKSYKIEPASDLWKTITGKVINNAKHAFLVEFGTRRAKKYNKPKGNVFFLSWEYKGLRGARMLTRAVDENRSRLSKILNK